MPLLQVIITTSFVLVINPEDENVLPFIKELKSKLSQPAITVSPSYPLLNELSKRGKPVAEAALALKPPMTDETPFELRALEVCLDHVSCGAWPESVSDFLFVSTGYVVLCKHVEQVCLPALDGSILLVSGAVQSVCHPLLPKESSRRRHTPAA